MNEQETQPGTSECEPIENGLGVVRMGVVLVVLGVLVALGVYSQKPSGPVDPITRLPAAGNKLIAIGELKCLSEDPDHLAPRIERELIQRFGELFPSADIPQRAERFRNGRTDSLSIARGLGVTTLLEGTLRLQTNELSLSARLRQVSTGKTLWESAQTKPWARAGSMWTNLLQDVVSSALGVVNPRQKAKIEESIGLRIRAVEHCRTGRSLLDPFTRDGALRAAQEFNKATELSPSYIEAHLALVALHERTADRFRFPKDAMSRALQALDEALALGREHPEVHAQMALLKMHNEWDWVGAEREFQNAIAKDPLNPEYPAWYARLLQCRNRLPEARVQVDRALALRPASFEAITACARQFALEGRFDAALETFNRSAGTPPSESIYERVSILMRAGRLDDAITLLQNEEPDSNSAESLAWSGFLQAKLGRTAEAERKLRDLRTLSRRTYISPRYQALICVALDRKREALMHLGNAYTYRSPFMSGLKTDFPWSSLQDEPAFQELVRRVGL